jgi:thiamine-monophosphate kinase
MELRRLFAGTAEGEPVGIGDDAAVFKESPGYQGVWSTDMMLEGVHFLRSWQSGLQLGAKSLIVNVSDLAAMGAMPRYALLSLALPPDTEVDFILDLCRGFRDVALREEIAIVGGDTCASHGGLVVSVSVGGFVAEGKAVLRSGASPGDVIVVTGYLGSAAGGLGLLKESLPDQGLEALKAAFIEPAGTLSESRRAVAAGASAMTDLSDGLATDLRHICLESSTAALVYELSLPIHPELRLAAERYGWDPVSLALSGGEDYGLLFTLPKKGAEATVEEMAAKTGSPVTIIGEMIAGSGIDLVRVDGSKGPLTLQGFDHFAR